MISPNNLLYMRCMDANPDNFSCFYPSSMPQDLMVSVILSTYWVRPASTLAKDSYDGALEFLLDNSGRTMGLNSPMLRRTCASMDQNTQQRNSWCNGKREQKHRGG
jgi:hypothetical protein